MSKKNRLLERERAKQIVAAQRRAQERRKRLAIAGAAVAVVVVALAILVAVKFTGGSSKHPSAPSGVASAQLAADVTGVPAATLDKVGTGAGVSNLPKPITGQAVLTDGGKPLIVYMGAEYCPYCAAERWAMVVALSRFGTFHNLGQTHSSSSDVYPNTATLSFHGATYTSQYLTFQGVEQQSNVPDGNNSYKPLDTPTAQQQELLKKFDAPPYVSADSAGSIPFIDFGNQALVSGASFSPQLLAGKSADQIGAALKNPDDPITKAVLGTANAFTTELCQLTKGQPAGVCTSTAAKAYQGKLNGQS